MDTQLYYIPLNRKMSSYFGSPIVPGINIYQKDEDFKGWLLSPIRDIPITLFGIDTSYIAACMPTNIVVNYSTGCVVADKINVTHLFVNEIEIFELLKKSVSLGGSFTTDMFKFAVQNNYHSIMRWLHENNCPYSIEDVRYVSQSDISTMELVRSFGWDLEPYYLYKNAKNAENLEWTWKNMGRLTSYSATKIYARAYGSLEKMKWVRNKGYLPTGLAYCQIVNNICYKNVELLKWLKNEGCTMTNGMYVEALICKCDLEIFNWLYRNKAPLTIGEFYLLRRRLSHDKSLNTFYSSRLKRWFEERKYSIVTTLW